MGPRICTLQQAQTQSRYVMKAWQWRYRCALSLTPVHCHQLLDLLVSSGDRAGLLSSWRFNRRNQTPLDVAVDASASDAFVRQLLVAMAIACGDRNAVPAPDTATATATDTATGAASSGTSASGAGGGAGAGAGAIAASSSTAAAHFSPAQVYIGSPAYPVSTSLPAEPKRESLSAVETVMHTLVRAQRAALMQRALVLATLPHIANSKGVILEHRMPVGTSAPAAASRRSTEGSDGSAMATPLTCALVHGVRSQVWTLHQAFINGSLNWFAHFLPPVPSLCLGIAPTWRQC